MIPGKFFLQFFLSVFLFFPYLFFHSVEKPERLSFQQPRLNFWGAPITPVERPTPSPRVNNSFKLSEYELPEINEFSPLSWAKDESSKSFDIKSQDEFFMPTKNSSSFLDDCIWKFNPTEFSKISTSNSNSSSFSSFTSFRSDNESSYNL